MNLTTQTLTELKDQMFFATETGDLDTLKRILDLFPELTKEMVHDMNVFKFAARHGHRHILKALFRDVGNKDVLIDLIKAASVDGHLETIAYIVHLLSKYHSFNVEDLRDPMYIELKNIVPESCKNAIYFPYAWSKVKGMLFVYKQGKLPEVPIKKLAKYLIPAFNNLAR